MQDPSKLTATQVIRLMQDGRLRAEELMEACLDRIAARESAVRAFAWFEADAAMRAAASAHPGPLHGVPIGVKDIIDTADMPTEHGSTIWRGWRPRADAASIAWAKAMGGVILGKTVTTEFATRRPGPTANPHRLSHTPGGSSSGSAAAVADCFVPLAFGTQTGGSVIRPAAYCGVVGFKPSFGLINRAGMKIMSDSLDTIGVMARSIADCALLTSVVSDADLGDPDAKPDRAPRIGLCRSPYWDKALPETKALFEGVARALARAGASLAECELPERYARLGAAQPIVVTRENARSMGWELSHHRGEISPVLLDRLESGLAHSGEAVAGAYATLAEAQQDFPAVIEGFDVLVTPSAPGQAPEGLDWTGDQVFNFIWTSLHVPCVTVPAGLGPDGLPLGIQIVGRQGEDRATLAWARFVADAVVA